MSQQQQQNILPLINADLRGFTVDCFGRCYPVTTHAKWPFFALRANKKRATYRPNFTQAEAYSQRLIRYACNTLEMDKKGVALQIAINLLLAFGSWLQATTKAKAGAKARGKPLPLIALMHADLR